MTDETTCVWKESVDKPGTKALRWAHTWGGGAGWGAAGGPSGNMGGDKAADVAQASEALQKSLGFCPVRQEALLGLCPGRSLICCLVQVNTMWRTWGEEAPKKE